MNIKSKCFSVSIKRTRRYTNNFISANKENNWKSYWDSVESNCLVYQENLFYADTIEEVKKEVNQKIEADKFVEEHPGKIYSDDDYEFDILQLKYIVLTGQFKYISSSLETIELVEKVNKHLEKGWKPLGGIQIAGAGGDSSDYSEWSEWRAAQSLICCDC